MTPTVNTDSGRCAPVLGTMQSPDATPVTILDEDGEILFQGVDADAEAFMQAHGLRPHCNCEVIEDRDYVLGLENF